MPADDGPDPAADPYRPPDVPVEVRCLRCDREYASSLIKWVEQPVEGDVKGAWCCPTKGCGGKGFGLDVLPTDPDYDSEADPLRWQFDDPESDNMDDINELDGLVDVVEVNELAEIDELTGQPGGELAADVLPMVDDDDNMW